MVELEIDHRAIEKNKQLRRDLWDYRPVEHLPVVIWLNHLFGHTYREFYESPEIHLEVNVERIRKSIALLPDDYIPFARIVRGPMTIATMFGAGIAWTDDPNEAPGGDGPVVTDLEAVYALRRPSLEDGIMGEHLRRIRHHAGNLPHDVYLTGVFAGGPLQVAADLVESNAFYAGFYDNPDAMRYLLDMVTELQIEIYRATAEAAGGLERLTTLDFDPVWAPEKHKCILSDDISVPVGPRIFRQYSVPYNNRVYAPWGSGMLHVCGPQVAKRTYMDHVPRLKGLNCAYHWTRDEFSELREIFAGWGMLEVNFDMVGEGPDEMLAGFRHMMECLAPDVIAVPVCTVDEMWTDADITAFYWDMRKIAREYAANMRWRTAS
jgi:uroporphyrinogen-III decarboxylase